MNHITQEQAWVFACNFLPTEAAQALGPDESQVICNAAIEWHIAQQAAPDPLVSDDLIICPECCSQFRAIPVNVQIQIGKLVEALEGQEPVEKIEERSADYWVSKFPVPLGYKLVKETWESSPPLSQDNPDFIVNPVEYQYAYPDGTWRCSNGDRINGMKPTASRALYATRNSS